MKRLIPILFFVVILLILGLVIYERRANHNQKEIPPRRCSEILTREVLEKSLDLGTSFILNNQKEPGNFYYEYNWQTKEDTKGDSQVRQAGAAWGLALIFNNIQNKKVEEALLKALKFFKENSKLDDQGNRYVVYPEEKVGRTGTVALVALAHIDYLRSPKKSASLEELKQLKEDLSQYLGFLIKARMPSGLWNASYQFSTGTPFGSNSPYFDGESLLALIKAYNYLGRKDLKEIILESADTGYQKNIVEALEKDPDSRITKGYYQWSSMSYYEIIQSDLPKKEKKKYGDALIDLADWMIDVHKTLRRTRNTGYAYEGIIHAYKHALDTGDREHAEKFKCVIGQGLEKLTSWQVGSPIANYFVIRFSGGDPRAIGGVQNHSREAPLRIDVAQHQMHAVILALKYVYEDKKPE